MDTCRSRATQGTKQAVTELKSLEGFTLDGAVAAARLTRGAYDIFVSPIVTFGTTITGDYLASMLRALQTARSVLADSNQDNPTLTVIQKILQTWVNQVTLMPKPPEAITNADLDRAQAYLRALHGKCPAKWFCLAFGDLIRCDRIEN